MEDNYLNHSSIYYEILSINLFLFLSIFVPLLMSNEYRNTLIRRFLQRSKGETDIDWNESNKMILYFWDKMTHKYKRHWVLKFWPDLFFDGDKMRNMSCGQKSFSNVGQRSSWNNDLVYCQSSLKIAVI